jgi:hypothetical protein
MKSRNYKKRLAGLPQKQTNSDQRSSNLPNYSKKYISLFKELYTIPVDNYQKLHQEGTKYRKLLSLDGTHCEVAFRSHLTAIRPPWINVLPSCGKKPWVFIEQRSLPCVLEEWTTCMYELRSETVRSYKKIPEFFDTDLDIENMIVEMRKIACQILEIDERRRR